MLWSRCAAGASGYDDISADVVRSTLVEYLLRSQTWIVEAKRHDAGFEVGLMRIGWSHVDLMDDAELAAVVSR